MDRPKHQDEVLVILRATTETNKHNDAAAAAAASLMERRVVLSRANPTISIGRTSRRKAELEGAPNNFFFDCPVMSREHAVLILDADRQRVTIKDAGSLHGTHVNKERLGKKEHRPVRAGDILTFGTTIDRGVAQYHPFEVDTDLTFGTEAPRLTPGTYQVPDESEIEISSDEDIESSPEMEYAHSVLKRQGMRPAPIDLTSDNESSAISPTYHEQSRTAADTPPHPSSTQGHYFDLTLSNTEPVPAMQDEVEDGAGSEIPDMDDDREYSGDDDRWDDEESVREILDDDSEVSDSAQHNFPQSDEPTLAVDGESDNKAQVENFKGPFHTEMHQMGQNGFDSDVLPPIRPSQPCDILPPITSAPGVGREAMSGFYERADNLGRMANPAIYPAYQFPPVEPTHYPAVRSDNQLPEPSLGFLDYPQSFGFPTAVPVPAPEYDDTSAFSYEQSKKRIQAPLQPAAGIEAAGQDDVSQVNTLQEVPEVSHETVTPGIQHAPKRTLDEISQSAPEEEHLISIQKDKAEIRIVETSEVAPITTPKPEPSPTKRNIDEISDAEPEKEQALLASKRKKTFELKLSDPITIPNDAPQLILPSRHSLASCQAHARPVKRLKKAAEVFGYVALGGVAVMSALIATAPAL